MRIGNNIYVQENVDGAIRNCTTVINTKKKLLTTDF